MTTQPQGMAFTNWPALTASRASPGDRSMVHAGRWSARVRPISSDSLTWVGSRRATISRARHAGPPHASSRLAHSRPGASRRQRRARVTTGSAARQWAGARSELHHARHAPACHTDSVADPGAAAAPRTAAGSADSDATIASAAPNRTAATRLAERGLQLAEVLLEHLDLGFAAS